MKDHACSRTLAGESQIKITKKSEWIRRGWISRFWGAPIFHPEVPAPVKISILGQIGAPQHHEIQPRRIQPPILGPSSAKMPNNTGVDIVSGYGLLGELKDGF